MSHSTAETVVIGYGYRSPDGRIWDCAGLDVAREVVAEAPHLTIVRKEAGGRFVTLDDELRTEDHTTTLDRGVTTMDTLNPDALAEWGDEQGAPDSEVRANVQRDVTPEMITAYVIAEGELPEQSARPFGEYLHEAWNDYVEYEDMTHRALIAGALEFWRGNS